MSNSSFACPLITVFSGATLSLTLAGFAVLGCGGTTDTTSGSGGTTATAGATSLAGSNGVAGSSDLGGAESGGSSARGGSSSSAGNGGASGRGSSGSSTGGSSNLAGASGTAGASNGGAGGSTSGGPSCSTLTTLAACTARTDCYAISEPILCPGSGTPCPSQFKRCSDNGCDPACTSGSVCVRELTQGGALIMENDAGACPTGSSPSGFENRCTWDPTYTCKPIPAACGTKLDCTCAASLCLGCRTASAAQVDCEEDVP